MSARNVLESQQSVQAAVAGRSAAGCWKLTPGRALSLRPRQHSLLQIAQGSVWITLGGASPTDLPGGLPADLPRGGPDHVLQAGDRLVVAAGQHLVMEVWSPAGQCGEEVAFQWTEAPVVLPSVQGRRAQRPRAAWECGVVQPLHDLGRAVAQAFSAGGRLALGVTRFALVWIANPRESKPA